MSGSHVLSLVVLRLLTLALGLLAVACGSSTPPTPAAPTSDTPAPPSGQAVGGVHPGGPRPEVLGLRLLAPVADVRRLHPELTWTDSAQDAVIGNGTLMHGGEPWEVHLVFHEEQLAQITAHRERASIADLEAMAAELDAELGEGQPRLCASEVGPPLAQYLSSGRGAMSRSWASPSIRGDVSLSATMAGDLQLRLFLEGRPLADRHRPALDFKSAGSKVTRAAPPNCPELGSLPPSAFGLTFGDSPDELRAQLGTQERLERYQGSVPHRLAGVDGELILRFYDDCLAVVMFVTPGDLATYRALQSAMLQELPTPERQELCSPDGQTVTDAQVIAQEATLQTRWSGPPLQGHIQLSRLTAQDPVQVTLELDATALRDRAPQIDF